MKYKFNFLCCAILFVTNITAQNDVWRNKIEEAVLQSFERGNTDVEIFVLMREQANLDLIPAAASKTQKGEQTYHLLRGVAERHQKNIQIFLQTNQIDFQSFWIVNCLFLKTNFEITKQLAQREDVAQIINNPTSRLHTIAVELPKNNIDTAWGLKVIRADSVWALGITGAGVTVGGADTGYDWLHPAVKPKYRGWNAATNSANHHYNWHDAIHTLRGTNPCGSNAQTPCDDNGHGTHTVGTMTGRGDTAVIGVAPSARWIGARNMDAGVGSLASYVECFEWFLAPTNLLNQHATPSLAPHVINNSWYCDTTEGCNASNFAVLERAMNATRAAGIVVVVSVGNAGPNCSSATGPPGFFSKAFSVGATQQNDTIAGFSSRGAVTIDGSNRLKPDISAPGVAINSAVLNNAYRRISGTSMAGPHVAGVVALMISANPLLAGQVDTIEWIIRRTAKPLRSSQSCGAVSGATIPNNTYGWGRIDALAAVRAAQVWRPRSNATNEKISNWGMRVFPNPAADFLHVYIRRDVAQNADYTEGGAMMQIFNLSGQMVFVAENDGEQSDFYTYNIASLSSGWYVWKMRVGDKIQTGKVQIIR